MARRKGPSLSHADVVAAAITVLEAEGPEALGMSRVAAELKIKPASMYNHVASAEALAKLVALEANRQILAVLQAATQNLSDPREHLRALAFSMRRWATQNKGLYGHLARVPPNYSDQDSVEVLDAILALFDRPLQTLGIVQEQRVHAMRSIRSALHGFVMLEADGEFQLQEATEDSFRWMVDGIIRGLEGRAGADG